MQDARTAYAENNPHLVRVRSICLDLEGAEETDRFSRHTFCVTGEPFASFGGDPDFPYSVLFIPDPAAVDELLGNPAAIALSQLSERPWLGWNVQPAGTDWARVEALLAGSYELTLTGL